MEANEVMIGDWLKNEELECEVSAIYANGIMFEDRIGAGAVSFDRLNPIPLTAEILKANNFRVIGGHWYSDDIGDNYELEVVEYTDSIWQFRYVNLEMNIGDSRMFVGYVHELQHALRLCGIDKKIVL